MASSYFVKLTLPPGILRESRDSFSQIVPRIAAKFSFQGLEDWSVDLKNSPVLGVESEFHDLTRLKKPGNEMRVYFAKKQDAAKFQKLLRAVFADIKTTSPRALAARDWMKQWRKHYKTQIIREGKRKLAIVPSWLKCPKTIPSVRISPGQAFGTGTHPTTRLCLELLLKYGAGSKVLDFGAGTGILALAAEKLYQAKGLAVESDSVALAQAKKNAKLNRAKAIRFSKTFQTKSYDLVFANVLAPVLLAHKAQLLAAVNAQGRIFLSGILASEAKSFMREFCAEGFSLEELRTQGQWAAISLKRGSAR